MGECKAVLLLLLVLSSSQLLMQCAIVATGTPVSFIMPPGDLHEWEAPPQLKQSYPYYLSGFDDENRPIWVIEFGKWDVKGAVSEGGPALALLDKYISQWAFRMVNSTGLRSTAETPVNDFVFVIDMDGYSLSQFSSYAAVSFLMKKGKELHGVLEKADVGYIVNASFLSRSLIKLLAPVFGAGTQNVQVYGSDRSTWVPTLLRRLPADQLPPRYGGTSRVRFA